MIKIGTALFEACEELEKERGISKEVLIASLCDAMVAAYKKSMRCKDAVNIEAILDEQSGEIGVFCTKVVVNSVEEGMEDEQISLAEAKEIDEDVELEDEVKIEVTPEQFGRIAAQAAKQVITQRIREAERNLVLNEFLDKKGTLTLYAIWEPTTYTLTYNSNGGSICNEITIKKNYNSSPNYYLNHFLIYYLIYFLLELF